MSSISDVTTTKASGLTSIDALLDTGPGWNWLMPIRDVIYFTFSTASGNLSGDNSIKGDVTAFNATQQAACISQLTYISQLTGIKFSAVDDGTIADLHFANANLSPLGSGISGYYHWNYYYGYSYGTDGNGQIPGTDLITSFSIKAYVYLNNAEYATDNGNPVAGSWGYEYLLHELGHALGLKHPFQGAVQLTAAETNTYNTLMAYTFNGGPYSVFSPYDVSALMWLYGGDGIGGTLGLNSPGSYVVGNGQADNISGSAGGDVLSGGLGNDYLSGGNGKDTIDGGVGDDAIDGGGGIDIAVYASTRANFTLVKTNTGFSVTDTKGTAGVDTLSNIERIKFSDLSIAFDVGSTQSGGEAQLLLGAVLGKTLTALKKPLIGTVIDLFDQGYTMPQLSGALMRLDIWGVLTGNATATNTQIANYLLTTVNKVAPDSATLAAAVASLDSETGASQGNFLSTLALSDANQTQVGLVGLATTGLEYGGV